MSPAPAEEPRAWLVFRLGPHLMCASALDVEGIIEPVKPRPVPFSPPHMLGWFDFRGGVAGVISLRTKFGVKSGADSASGPYIVARVKGELAAFWVDEVRDVLESHQVEWQRMPEMPGAAAFDRYTIQNNEVVLRTTFEQLLRADSVATFDAVPGALAPEPEATPEPEAAREPEATSEEPAVPVVDMSAPAPVVDEPAPSPSAREESPPTQAPKAEPLEAPPAPPRYSDPLREKPASAFRKADPPRPPPRPRAAETSPLREPARPSRPAARPREIPVEPDTRKFDDDLRQEMEPQLPEEPVAERRRRWGAVWIALAAVIVVGAALWWWMSAPEGPAPEPVATGPIATPPAPEPTPPPPAPIPPPPVQAPPPVAQADVAPAPPPATTRVLTLEAREFKLTVDRPAKPAPPAVTAPANRPAADAARITYVVVRGDTLGHIAHRFLGDAARYPELAQLSRIRNPHLIYPGDIVTIDKVRPQP